MKLLATNSMEERMKRVVWQIELDGDVHAAGYDGNWFRSEREAQAQIPSLREVFAHQGDRLGSVSFRRILVANLTPLDYQYARSAGAI